MDSKSLSLPELRAELIRLGAERLEIGAQLTKVPEGPGYYDTMQPLLARQGKVNSAFAAIQKQIKKLQQGVQASLI